MINTIKTFLVLFIIVSTSTVTAQKVHWKYSSESKQWVNGANLTFKKHNSSSDITIYSDEKLQTIEGFGACFNELGWEALNVIDPTDKNEILNGFFSKDQMNFTLCRMPLGSNDYSFNYYSYNDVPEDFEMKNFSIDRDRYILIPYIKSALAINPELKIWASPWVPPLWMKINNHYAMGSWEDKSMDPGKRVSNNATAFRMEDRYLSAYALYFSKFVQAYKNEGIDISLVQVQNEPVYQPHWQSCTWRPEDLAFFIGEYLGPQFEKDSTTADIWLGTVNSSDPNFALKILKDEKASKYIKGLGMQWDAKYAVSKINTEMPELNTMQTESECGNGENNWGSAEYTWSLINTYLNNGVNSYMYWNMILEVGGKSTWNWPQNSLITIDRNTQSVTYNMEYYIMKHLSHYVLPGSKRLKTSGGGDHLAFETPEGQTVLVMIVYDDNDVTKNIAIDGKQFTVNLKANSINTFSW